MARRLRVVAGEAGGLHLVAPSNARPTTDRVREALFSALGSALGADALEGSAVLDLFAGSGALAIEALSRGAERAVLVDRDPKAQDACERNLATTRLAGRARVHRGRVSAFLAAGPPAEAPFDLVFCDPPYDLDDAEVAQVLDALRGPGWLGANGTVVVERPGPAWSAPPGWTTSWERRYGDTLVTVVHATDVAF